MIIGIDIGATRTKIILWKGKILKKTAFSTPREKGSFLYVLEEKIRKISSGREIRGISFSIPGVLGQKREKILITPNIEFLSQLEIRDYFKKKFKKNIIIENDSVCFTLAESILGAGKNYKSILGITLGTGVGGGFILKKKNNSFKIYKGCFAAALEPGGLILDIERAREEINKGKFDWFGSKKFFLEKGYNPEEVYKEALLGRKFALSLFREYGKILGMGVGSLINVLDPEVVILGGGISKSFRFFSKALKEEAKKVITSPLSKKFVKIKKGKLNTDFAAAIGAVLLFQHGKNKDLYF